MSRLFVIILFAPLFVLIVVPYFRELFARIAGLRLSFRVMYKWILVSKIASIFVGWVGAKVVLSGRTPPKTFEEYVLLIGEAYLVSMLCGFCTMWIALRVCIHEGARKTISWTAVLMILLAQTAIFAPAFYGGMFWINDGYAFWKLLCLAPISIVTWLWFIAPQLVAASPTASPPQLS